jgi:hypothetical protein
MPEATPLGFDSTIATALVALLDADPATLQRTLGNATMAYLSANLVAADDFPAALGKIEDGVMIGLYLGDGKLLVSKRRARWLRDLAAARRLAHSPERR